MKREEVFGMNRLIVLGCHSPYPAPGGATPGYLLQYEGKNYLIDCGSGVLSQLGKYISLSQLDAVFLSHLHSDHFSDFLTLQYGVDLKIRLGKRKSPLPVYAPNDPSERFQMLAYKDRIEVNEIQEGQKIPLGEDGFIQFFQTSHGITCYAMKIAVGSKSIFYGADSGPETDWEKIGLSSPDLAILESTFPLSMEPKEATGHLSSRQAGLVAKQLGAKQLWLTHLYPEFDPILLKKEAEEVYPGKIVTAYAGLTYDFR